MIIVTAKKNFILLNTFSQYNASIEKHKRHYKDYKLILIAYAFEVEHRCTVPGVEIQY